MTLIGAAAATWPFAAWAQEAGRIYRLGSLHLSPRSAPQHVAFYEELQRSGFVEGKNLSVDERGYGLRAEQVAEHASELIKSQVDVIVCAGDASLRAAQQATKTILILGNADDMLGSGLVGSLAKPEGNTTGLSFLSTELDGKRQEIVMEAVPGIFRMAALIDGKTNSTRQLQMLQGAALARGVELSVCPATTPEEIATAIDAAKSSGAAALNVLSSAFLYNNRQIILERVAKLRLPTIYQWAEVAKEGGLIAYGPSLVQVYRENMARQLIALLRGTRPGDIPVEQPAKFVLAINLITAKAAGVVVPPTLLASADEVIE
jgi:putative ABC transport system substrate-binding protein